MHLRLATLSLASLVSLMACSGDAELDCSAFLEDLDACVEAGCQTEGTQKAHYDSKNACSFYDLADFHVVCVQPAITASASTVYFRKDDPSDVRVFSSDVGPLPHWTRCADSDRGTQCGCSFKEGAPPLD